MTAEELVAWLREAAAWLDDDGILQHDAKKQLRMAADAIGEAYQRGRRDENEACALLCEQANEIEGAWGSVAAVIIRKRCEDVA